MPKNRIVQCFLNGEVSEQFGCKSQMQEEFKILPHDPIFTSESSVLFLERHKTVMFDVDFLRRYPDCFGAFLIAFQDNPNPFVVVLYDRINRRPVYRIAQISDVLKK